MTIIDASPQFITAGAPTSMQDAMDRAEIEEGTLREQLAQRGQSLLEALQMNATLLDTVLEQEKVLTHQTEMLTLMTEFINERIAEGNISPQLSELADRITSSNAYAATAWMSDQT